MKLARVVMAILIGLPRMALHAQVSPPAAKGAGVVAPDPKHVASWPTMLPDPNDCVMATAPVNPSRVYFDVFPPNDRRSLSPQSPQAMRRCVAGWLAFRQCAGFAVNERERTELRTEAFVRDSVSWGPVFQHLFWTLLFDMEQAARERTHYRWRVVVPYSTPEWQRFERVLRVALRASAPRAREQDIDQIIVGPLEIVGDSGMMRVTRAVATRNPPGGRVVKTTRSEFSLRYFVRSNCWQRS